jgi:hypothetical protein
MLSDPVSTVRRSDGHAWPPRLLDGVSPVSVELNDAQPRTDAQAADASANPKFSLSSAQGAAIGRAFDEVRSKGAAGLPSFVEAIAAILPATTSRRWIIAIAAESLAEIAHELDAGKGHSASEVRRIWRTAITAVEFLESPRRPLDRPIRGRVAGSRRGRRRRRIRSGSRGDPPDDPEPKPDSLAPGRLRGLSSFQDGIERSS